MTTCFAYYAYKKDILLFHLIHITEYQVLLSANSV